MVKLREELSRAKSSLNETRDALDVAKQDIQNKGDELDKCCAKIEELEKRIEKIISHGHG
jgi:chromosome segregation ATPase